MLYSIIVPCYKSALSIRKVVEETSAWMEKLGRTPYEFVLVDDCSPDDHATLDALHAVADDYDFVKVIELGINAGQHNATMAGLNYAKGDVMISMDDDLQTHPSQLPLLFEKFDEGYDVVYGYYPQKKHSPFRNFGSWVNYETVRILIGKPKDMKTSSFWIMRKFVRDSMIRYTNQYTHLQGLILRTTRNIASVPVQHFDRAYGESGYTFKKLLKLWSNIIGFSVVPLKLVRYCGTFFAGLGLVGALIILIHKIITPTIQLGWSSLMVSIFFFSGLILLSLGLIGEYIGRMFLGMSNYPQYVLRQVYTKADTEPVPDKEEESHGSEK